MAGSVKDLGDSDRLTAREIFESAAQHAREELRRPWSALTISGMAGGLTMGLIGLSTGLVTAMLGSGDVSHFIAALVYPVGFLGDDVRPRTGQVCPLCRQQR
jgi:formate/nitrite transporter FocA (FNT family)